MLSRCSWVTLCSSWSKNVIISALFEGLRPSITQLITFQRFLVGFRSSDWAGHDMVLICWFTLINLSVWPLYCWKSQSSESRTIQIVRAEGNKCFFLFVFFRIPLLLGLILHKLPKSSLAEAPSPRSSPILHHVSQWVRDAKARIPLQVSV